MGDEIAMATTDENRGAGSEALVFARAVRLPNYGGRALITNGRVEIDATVSPEHDS